MGRTASNGASKSRLNKDATIFGTNPSGVYTLSVEAPLILPCDYITSQRPAQYSAGPTRFPIRSLDF